MRLWLHSPSGHEPWGPVWPDQTMLRNSSLTRDGVRTPRSPEILVRRWNPSFRILQALSSMFVYTLVLCVSAVAGVDSISWEYPLEWKR
jgi:hypothetical protein